MHRLLFHLPVAPAPPEPRPSGPLSRTLGSAARSRGACHPTIRSHERSNRHRKSRKAWQQQTGPVRDKDAAKVNQPLRPKDDLSIVKVARESGSTVVNLHASGWRTWSKLPFQRLFFVRKDI